MYIYEAFMLCFDPWKSHGCSTSLYGRLLVRKAKSGFSSEIFSLLSACIICMVFKLKTKSMCLFLFYKKNLNFYSPKH